MKLSISLPSVFNLILLFFCFIRLSSANFINVTQSIEDKVHHRAKRWLWYNTRARKFVLPEGSTLVISPKLQVPFLRQPPEGINSDIQITWPFYMFFDKLGMTGPGMHPWPPFYPFSGLFPPRNRLKSGDSGKKSKDKSSESDEDKRNLKGENLLTNHLFRVPRSATNILDLPDPDNIHGGERATMIPRIEKILGSFGIEGRNCMLRMVCEVHEFPLEHEFNLFGEILQLIFSISNSRYAKSHMPDYLKAEEAGKEGDCREYFKNCSKSIFVWENKYTKEAQNFIHENHNEI